MALIEGRLRGFEKQPRRTSRKIGGSQLEFGGSIERDGTQGLRARPPLHHARGNRLVEGPKRRRRRNHRQKLRRIIITGAKFFQAKGSVLAKVRFWKALDSHAEIAARMRGVTVALGVAPEPVERVRSVGGNGIAAQERNELVIRIRLAIQIRDPGDAPLAIGRVFSGGKIVEDALVVDCGFGAVELDRKSTRLNSS